MQLSLANTLKGIFERGRDLNNTHFSDALVIISAFPTKDKTLFKWSGILLGKNLSTILDEYLIACSTIPTHRGIVYRLYPAWAARERYFKNQLTGVSFLQSQPESNQSLALLAKTDDAGAGVFDVLKKTLNRVTDHVFSVPANITSIQNWRKETEGKAPAFRSPILSAGKKATLSSTMTSSGAAGIKKRKEREEATGSSRFNI